MDLWGLQVFLAVVEHGTFRAAAPHLHVSQSAVSQAIQTLEDTVGAQLLDRNRGGTRLTHAGKVFIEYASRIVRDIEDAQRAVNTWRGIKGGWLRVGHSPVHRELAVATVALMLRKTATLRVTLEESDTPQIEQHVRQGALDLGVVHALAEPAGFSRKLLTVAALRLAVNIAHPLARTRAIGGFDALARERFVLTRGGLRSRHRVNLYFEKHGFVPTVAVETNAMTNVLATVRASRDLVSVVPMPAPHLSEPQHVAFIDLPGPCETDSSFLIWKGSSDEPESEPGRGFYQAIFTLLASQPSENL
jgi:LysR family cyn operon transcriptional activator